MRSLLVEEPVGTSNLSWYEGREDGWGKRSPVGTAVGENECNGTPGVCCAHVQRIVRFGAELPGRVEVVKVAAYFDWNCGVRVAVGEAFVDDTVVNN